MEDNILKNLVAKEEKVLGRLSDRNFFLPPRYLAENLNVLSVSNKKKLQRTFYFTSFEAAMQTRRDKNTTELLLRA